MAEVELQGLTIQVDDRALVEDVALTLRSGELVGLVGASGSGKTLTCRSLLGLVDLDPGVVAAELRIEVDGREHSPYHGLHGTSRRRRDRAFHAVRGSILGYLPQDGGGALEPFRRVGAQLAAVARLGGQPPDPLPWLHRAGFDPADATRVAGSWPHQLSGGMAQRVAIAAALARGSRFLLADEPTTSLDGPLQLKILATLRALADAGLGVLLITHDLRSLVPIAHRAVLMDRGRRVETLSSSDLAQGVARSVPGRRLLDAARASGLPFGARPAGARP